MKKILSGLFLLSVLACGMVYANNDCVVIGYHEPGSNTYDGPTYCKNVSVSNIVVRGPLYSTSSVFTGETDVSGPITSNKSIFDHILSEANGSTTKIKLSDASHVKGDIVFKGMLPGIVYLAGGSTVTGKVVNGTIK